MKKYFISQGNFDNEYLLRWAETPEQETLLLERGYNRIKKRDACVKCRDENRRRKHDWAFSGYGNNIIYPFDWKLGDNFFTDDYWAHPNDYEINNYVLTRI